MLPHDEFTADGLLVDDLDKGLFQVDRRTYFDRSVFEAEQRLIFARTWLYVGHESEIAENGSFVTRTVAGWPVILVRDDAGQVRVLFNTCSHRGNTVCQLAAGKTKSFRCFYHGFLFNTRGALVGIPDRAGYSDKLDLGILDLRQAPRVESYRGLVFMSLKADIETLRSFLGGVTEYIDIGLDCADSDTVIAAGHQSYSFAANWKLLMDNSADAYHGLIMHKRYFIDYIGDIGGDTQTHRKIAADDPENTVIAFKNGHSVIEMPLGGLPLSAAGGQVYAQLRQDLELKHGKERARRLLGYSRNILIFPNLSFITHFRSIRTFYSPTPERVDVSVWPLVGENDSAALRELRFSSFVSFLGPGGFGTPDDVEALENCQRNFSIGQMQWADLSRGMHRAGGPIPNDELQMRAFWRQWYGMLNPTYQPQVERTRHGGAQATHPGAQT